MTDRISTELRNTVPLIVRVKERQICMKDERLQVGCKPGLIFVWDGLILSFWICFAFLCNAHDFLQSSAFTNRGVISESMGAFAHALLTVDM